MIRRYADLAAAIRGRPARLGATRLVAVDGPGGAGKSLFAARLSRHLHDATVIPTDDFASWEEPVDWWPRLESTVLRQVAAGEPIRYEAYDWDARRYDQTRFPASTAVVILEGVSSARRAVEDRLAMAVWVETPRAERLQRGLARDGEEMRSQWLAWMAEEDRHFAADRTRERATLQVDGAPATPHDPEREFVELD